MATTPETPVKEFYEDTYAPDKHARPKQRNTRAVYRTDLEIFNQAFRFHLAERGLRLRHVTLGDLSPDDPNEPCDHLLADDLLKYAMAWQLNRGRTVQTANRLYRAVCAVWREAFSRGLVAAPPRTKAYPEPKLIPACWSLEEFQKLLAAAGELEGWVGEILARVFFPAYFWFTYAVGSRQSVTLELPTDNFDEQRGEVLLPAELQKQDADQIIELIPQAVEAIAKLQSAQRGLDRLFGDWTGSITNFNKRLRKIIVAAGLRKDAKAVTRKDLSHKVRKTFATHACANSDKETVRQLLGHSHVSVTERYLDPRFLPKVSARKVLPPLTPTDPELEPTDGPPAEKPTLRIHRPEAG